MPRTLVLTLSAAAILASLSPGGCVSPGSVEQDLVNRYQQRLLEQSPRDGRRSESGLGLLEPARRTGPELKVEPVVDATQRTVTTFSYRDLGTIERNGETFHRVETTTTIQVHIEVPGTDGAEPRRRSFKHVRTDVGEAVMVPQQDRVERVEAIRVGAESLRPSLVPGTEHMLILPLQEAVQRTLANDPDVRVVSYDPAIEYEKMVQAAGQFDVTVFGGFSHEHTDDRSASVFGGGERDTKVYSAGLRQQTPLGGSWQTTYSFTRTHDATGLTTLNESYEPRLLLELSQPLLRDAWPQFALSQLRIARLNRKVSAEQFRATVEASATGVIGDYWSLIQARRALQIQRSLLEDTIRTLDKVRARIRIDATDVQIKQTEARVASRRADLIRARKSVEDVQDALARRINDPQINLLSRLEVVPETPPTTAEIELDTTDQLLTALENSPALQQARLAIAIGDINVQVAENQLLPRLDLAAGVGWQGLDSTAHGAVEKQASLDYMSYNYSITFEYPLGNRARRAALRQSRYERLKSVAQLQQAADDLAQQVKERIRQVRTSFEEIRLQGEAVAAARRQLKALDDKEQIKGQLTPEFLQLKLDSQASLAAAELAELQAVLEYNTSLAQLAQLTGTTLQTHRVRMALPALMDEGPWNSRVQGHPVMPPVAEGLANTPPPATDE